ncbi:MAG: hypothetical protein JWN51_3145 [Phycisphaerales bacterium]|nr:hypothetical protein [Phycisphaerales bacterium]
MNAKIYLASLLALGSAAGIGCNHHHADTSADARPQVDQGGGTSADIGAGKIVGTVDAPAVDNKAAEAAKPVAPAADHVSTGADLKKPEAPVLPDVPTAPKPQPAPVPDVPKPEAPTLPEPTVKPDAPKPDAPAKPEEPSVKPDAPAPDPAKPDAGKASDAAKSAIEKEVGTQDASKAPDPAK